MDRTDILKILNYHEDTDNDNGTSILQTLQDNKDSAIPLLQEILEQALADENPDLQVSAAGFLALVAKSDAVDTLLNVFHDGRFQRRSFLILFLGLTEDMRVIPTLLEALASDDNRDSDFAQGQLNNMGIAAIPAIVDAFHNGNSKIRKGAAQRCGFYPNHALALPMLIEALHDAEPSVRISAVHGLSRFHYHEAVKALLEHILDNVPQVRQGVYTSLITLDPLTALKALLDLLRHLDENIRKEAIQILISDPKLYFLGGRTMEILNGNSYYQDSPELRELPSLTPTSDIVAYLHNTEVIYKTLRVCDIAVAVLREIRTSEAMAILEQWEPTNGAF